MYKPKILKDLEKLALHFVLDECVKRQNFLFENRCCYLKSSPLRTRKNSARILRTTTHYKRTASTTPLQSPSFSSQFPPRFKPQGSQTKARLACGGGRGGKSLRCACLNEKITTRSKKRTIST